MSSQTDRPPLFLTELGMELSRVAHDEATRRQRQRRTAGRRRSLVLAMATTLALAGAAGATTGIVSLPEQLLPGDGPPPQDGPRFAPEDETGSFAPELVRELSVLRRPRTATDSMGAAASYVTGSGAPGSSLRIHAPAPPAGVSHATVTDIPAWLIPTPAGTANMRMLSPGAAGPASGFAADVAMLEAGRAYMTLNDDLLGLAPDGVDRVTVTLRDGSQVELPVADNIFGARFDQGVADVQLGGRR